MPGVGGGSGVEVDAEQGVVVGQGAQHDGVPVGVLASEAVVGLAAIGVLAAQRSGRFEVARVVQDRALGPRALMAGDDVAVEIGRAHV